MKHVHLEPDHHLTQETLKADVVGSITRRWESDPRLGAVVSFAGVVRGDRIESGVVESIEFSAHEEMAEKSVRALVERLASEVSSDTVRVYLQHTLGTVPRGGIPLIIVIGTSHRREAFKLCSDILEALKQEVPIYGKEIADSGGHSWKVNQ